MEPLEAPELFVGLVAPIGVNLELVTELLTKSLGEMDYSCTEVRLTKFMLDVPLGLTVREFPFVDSYRDRIAYANELRRRFGDDAMATLAITAIRAFRDEQNSDTSKPPEIADDVAGPIAPSNLRRPEEKPLPRHAYIIRQFKRPEEIALMRSVYGRQFILVAAYAPRDQQLARISELERKSTGGQTSALNLELLSTELVAQDAKEQNEPHGQELRDAFPLADVFIEATNEGACEDTLRRFVRLLFGDNSITPTHDEYGMYAAKSASLRSSDLSRQVGAALFRPTGEVIALGCNEVPKASGGTYWTGDKGDRRDFVAGFDPNDQRKFELFVDVLKHLKAGNHLSDDLASIGEPHEIAQWLQQNSGSIRDAQIMDLLEFGRIIHAEMCALSDAARVGVSTRSATMYCTTFPCHICAKHIVAAGITRLVYLEPYPKSYATALHKDSIDVENATSESKVAFVPFHGVSPYRYRELFQKGKRKYSGGRAQRWNRDVKRPMIEVYYPSYFEAENYVVDLFRQATYSKTSTPAGSAPPPQR